MAKVTKATICFWCEPKRRFTVECENGQLFRIQCRPIKDCPHKYYSDLECVYNHDRLAQSLKRLGEKGQNKWQRITRDEALHEIAIKLRSHKNKYSAKTPDVESGTGRTYEAINSHFLNLFGDARTRSSKGWTSTL